MNLQEGQRVSAEVFQQIELNARQTTGALILIMTNGVMAKHSGLVTSRVGDRVKVAWGIATRAVNPPTAPGTHTVNSYIQLMHDEFAQRPATSFGVTRDDYIVVSPTIENDPLSERQFLLTDSLGTPVYKDGIPQVTTRTVVPSRTAHGIVEWIQANSSNQVSISPWSVPVGVVHLKADGSWTVENIEYPPCTVEAHRSRAVLDHPLGSVKANHLDPNIIGPTYKPGTHLTLEEIGKEIQAASGTSGSLNNRLDQLVDEAGNIRDDSVRDAIEDILLQILGGILDERGNLSADAVIRTGATSKFAVLSGTTSGGSPDGGGGLMPIPEGFTEDECYFISASRYVAFAVTSDVQVIYSSFNEGRRAHCTVTVERSDGTKPVYFGLVNFLVIGIHQ